jgi:hypothetical protein
MGFALAGWFFYPIAAALEGDSYYLHWQPRDSFATAIALIALAAVGTAAIHLTRRLSGRVGALVLLLISAIPLTSLSVGVMRQLPLRGILVPLWQSRAVALSTVSVAAAFLIVLPMARPELFRRWFWRLLVLLSPISVVVLVAVVASGRREPPALSVGYPSPAPSGAASNGPPALNARTAPSGPPPHEPRCESVLALLFDELSFSYLYDSINIREELPRMRAFGDAATHYLAVSSPGFETLVSMPGYLVGRRPAGIQIAGNRVLEVRSDGGSVPFEATGADGLFALAKRLGFTTEMAGYYFAYCEMLEGLLDSCRSFSFYNRSTFDNGLSLVDPVLTSLILWPRQFPAGLLKNPPFAVQQRRLAEEIFSFANRPLAPKHPVFRFVHFSVPHLPFVFSVDGYHPSWDPLRTSPDDQYVDQVRYADRLFGELLTDLEESGADETSTIVLLSDHGFRFGGRESDPRHIPFVVRRAGQRERADVWTEERGELLLRRVLESACSKTDY